MKNNQYCRIGKQYPAPFQFIKIAEKRAMIQMETDLKFMEEQSGRYSEHIKKMFEVNQIRLQQ